jgi:hypothetical protein
MQAERSGLVPTLVGGVIGAAVGVGLQVVLEAGLLGQRFEASWCAIVIGVLAGLGVRQANRHHMNRSYLRGAVSGLIALAAIVASSFAIKEVMLRSEVSPAGGRKLAAAKADAADATDDADNGAIAEAEAAEAPVADAGRGAAGVGGSAPQRLASDLNPWQFIFMGLGGLFAYELGRGADPAKRREVAEVDRTEPIVGGTDPST